MSLDAAVARILSLLTCAQQHHQLYQNSSQFGRAAGEEVRVGATEGLVSTDSSAPRDDVCALPFEENGNVPVYPQPRLDTQGQQFDIPISFAGGSCRFALKRSLILSVRFKSSRLKPFNPWERYSCLALRCFLPALVGYT